MEMQCSIYLELRKNQVSDCFVHWRTNFGIIILIPNKALESRILANRIFCQALVFYLILTDQVSRN